jgi:hypothetical protein
VSDSEDSDGDGATKKRKKQKCGKQKTYPTRNHRAKFVFDKEYKCFVPKWMMLVGSRGNTINTETIEGVKRLKWLFA